VFREKCVGGREWKAEVTKVGTPSLVFEEPRETGVELVLRDRKAGEPERASGAEDPFVDKNLGDTRRSDDLEFFASLIV
jgi:hypothetical protein